MCNCSQWIEIENFKPLRLRLVRVKVFPENRYFPEILFFGKENVFMCLVTFQKNFRKIFSDVWLYSWKYHRKHIFYLLLTFSQLPNKHIMSFIPKNSNKTQKDKSISRWDRDCDRDRRDLDRRDRDRNLADLDCDRAKRRPRDRDRDRRWSAQFRWPARSRSWCVGVGGSGAVKAWRRSEGLTEQCMCERFVRVREGRKSIEVKIRTETNFSRFRLIFRSNWKCFQFDRIL